MMKRVILLLLALVGVYGAVLSPYSLTASLEKKESLEQALVSKKQAEQSHTTARTGLVNAKNAFDSQRSFQAGYNELGKIKQLIDAVAGLSYNGMTQVDPYNGYVNVGTVDADAYNDESRTPPSAVKLSMYVEDIAAALDVINTMEMPVVSINTDLPGTVEVIFLTGGEG